MDRAEEPISGTRTALLDFSLIGVGAGPGGKVGVSVSVNVGSGGCVGKRVLVGMGVKVDGRGSSVGMAVGTLIEAQPLIIKTSINDAIVLIFICSSFENLATQLMYQRYAYMLLGKPRSPR